MQLLKIMEEEICFSLQHQKVDLRQKLSSKADGILAGVPYAKALSKTENFDCNFLIPDGQEVKKGSVIAELEGKASKLLSSERTFLNMLQHASGIATMAHKYASLIPLMMLYY